MQLDDEMIEARPAGEFGSGEQTMRGGQPRATESLSAQDFAEMGVKHASSATGQPMAAGGASVRPNEVHETNASSAAAARAGATDDTLLDLDDVEMPRASALAEADDFILDLQGTMPPQAAEFVEAQVISDVEQRAEHAPVEAQRTEAGGFQFYQQGAQATATEAEKETAYLADSSQMRETSELPLEAPLASIEESPDSSQAEETPRQTESAAPVAEPQQPSGQIGLDQLSPAAIDAIARRVVEQLSTTVVEQIAWEVVPQLAELLIKRRLEEEGKK
jgi:hypothetical protein